MLQGWALIVPIAIFNIAVGLWTWKSAEEHRRYLVAARIAGDPLFEAQVDHPDFPGMKEVSSARAKAAILVLSGAVLLLIQVAPAI